MTHQQIKKDKLKINKCFTLSNNLLDTALLKTIINDSIEQRIIDWLNTNQIFMTDPL